MTTANTIGPRILPMFKPESMALARLQLWIHEVNNLVDGNAKGDDGTKGRGNVWGKGGPFVRGRRLICSIQVPRIVLPNKVHHALHRSRSPDVNVPQHAFRRPSQCNVN